MTSRNTESAYGTDKAADWASIPREKVLSTEIKIHTQVTHIESVFAVSRVRWHPSLSWKKLPGWAVVSQAPC